MSAGAVAVLGVLLFAWALVSGALARRNVTGPLVFAVAGYVLANPDWGAVAVDVEAASVHLIAEVTLGLVLFADAARVNARELRADSVLPIRLLGVGLPLCIAAGSLVAAMVFDLPWGLALFIGASLAPTDAALSVQVINDARIPMRLRRSLNVESGLNDGIATPVVMVALAVAASQLGLVGETAGFELGAALRELGIGAVVGAVVGGVGAAALSHSSRQGWLAPGARRLATLALAVSALADRTTLDLERTDELPELGGELLALVVWFLFGATLLPVAFGHLDASVVAYSLASLTVVRMVPVALSMLGTGLDRPTTWFLAWFGPRGLASVVFALLAIEELGENDSAATTAVATIAMTVALSILLHGVSAGPGGRRYVRSEQTDHGDEPRARHSVLQRARGIVP